MYHLGFREMQSNRLVLNLSRCRCVTDARTVSEANCYFVHEEKKQRIIPPDKPTETINLLYFKVRPKKENTTH